MKQQQLRDILDRNEAQLLHIYFGHIAVHLLPLIRHLAAAELVSFHGADVMVDMEKPALSRRDGENAGSRPSRSRPLAIAARRRHSISAAPKEKFVFIGPEFRVAEITIR